MTFRSLTLRTDALVMEGLSDFERRSDMTVQRTPSEPDFWSGHRLVLHEPLPLGEAERRFAACFPGARHCHLVWDIADLPAEEVGGQVRGHLSRDDALALDGPIRRADPPDGVVIRAIEGGRDWSAVVALQCLVGGEQGLRGAAYRAYVARRFANVRSQVAEGRAAWFGAFDGDLLVGDLGLFEAGGLARFQSVETRAGHRRRGICAALLTRAHDWARARDPHCTLVIVALEGSDAGRLYHRAGFSLAERILAFEKPGY